MDDPAIRNYSLYPFADNADVLTHARIAADAVGATKTDRPEWAATHPVTGEVYVTVTNNASRRANAASSSEVPVDAANARAYLDPEFDGVARPDTPSNNRNWNGHIVRMREDGGKSTARPYTWNVCSAPRPGSTRRR